MVLEPKKNKKVLGFNWTFLGFSTTVLFSSCLENVWDNLEPFYNIEKNFPDCEEFNAHRIMVIRQLKVKLEAFSEPNVFFRT